MPPKVKVTVKDNGYKKVLASIAAAKDFNITVGVHSEDADGGVMMKANFIEEKAAFCSGFADEKGPDLVTAVRDDMAAAIKAGKNPIQRADQLAQKFAGDMQANFSNLIPWPGRVGGETVGVDTGQLRAAVRGKLEKK